MNLLGFEEGREAARRFCDAVLAELYLKKARSERGPEQPGRPQQGGKGVGEG